MTIELPSDDSNHSQKQQFQEVLKEAEAEVGSIGPNHEINTDTSVGTDGLEVVEVEVVQPILARSNEQPSTLHRNIVDGGKQYYLTVRKREMCPTCGFKPDYPAEQYRQADQDPPEIKGSCSECEEEGRHTLVCTDCVSKCEFCNRKMCGNCSDGYPTVEGSLCYRHREDAVELKKVDVAMRVREQELNQEAMHRQTNALQQIRNRQIDVEEKLGMYRIALQNRIQTHREQMDKVKAFFQHQERINAQNLEHQKLNLEREWRRRQQNIQEFQAASQAWLKNQSLELKQDEINLEREEMMLDDEFRHRKLDSDIDQWEKEHQFRQKRHSDEMDYKWGTHQDRIEIERQKEHSRDKQRMFDNRVKSEKHELCKIKSLLDITDRLDLRMESDQKKAYRNLKEATKRMSRNDQGWMTREITV